MSTREYLESELTYNYDVNSFLLTAVVSKISKTKKYY